MTDTFQDLLGKQASDVQPPTPLPAGTYKAILLSHEFGKTQNKGTDFVQWTLRPTEAVDVDADDLAEVNWSEKTLRYRQYITENSLFMVKRFLTDTLLLDSSNKTLQELIEESDEQELTIQIEHEPITDNNGQPTGDVRAAINDVAPAE